MSEPARPYPLGCEAVEAWFTFGPQRCGQFVTAVVTCEDVTCSYTFHEHAVCPDHGGPAYADPEPGAASDHYRQFTESNDPQGES